MLTILHVVGVISHHQLPLAHELVKLVGIENFRLVAMDPPSYERDKLGWNTRIKESWILRPNDVEKDNKEFEFWWQHADVVICDQRLFKLMKERINYGKLTFYMSERWWKPPIGMLRLLHPSFLIMTLNFLKLSSSPYFYYLPIGTYAARDISRIVNLHNRMFQWGYFTASQNVLSISERNKSELKVLWVGRMLEWKRVDTLIHAFSLMYKECSNATLTLVGDGDQREKLELLAKKLIPTESYKFISSIPAEEVINLMRQHHVYVLSSNEYEGWGAVVNEAISSGCSVIASDGAGSAKTMIEHGYNGLLFKAGDYRVLSEYLSLIAHNESFRRRLIKNAWFSFTQNWLPEIAAKRFLHVSEAIIFNKKIPKFNKGVMAPLKGFDKAYVD